MSLVRIGPGEDRIRDIYGNVIGNARIITDYYESSVDRQAALLRVSDYASGTGDYIELTTNNDGTFTLEEGGSGVNDFSLESTNLSTANNIRDAVDGITHLSAKVPSPHTWHPHVSIQYNNGHFTSVETRQSDNTTTPSSAWSFQNPNPQIVENEAPIAAIFSDDGGNHAAQPQFSNSNGLYEFYIDNRADISFFFRHPSASFTAESIEDVTLSGVGGGTITDTRTDISEDGSLLVEDVSDVNFSSNISVTDDGGGSVTVEAVGADLSYVHSQSTASSTWSINHGLSKKPSVIAVDSTDTVVTGGIEYIDNNNLEIHFTSQFSGKAYLN